MFRLEISCFGKFVLLCVTIASGNTTSLLTFQNSKQPAKTFWKLIRIHLKQLISIISKEGDSGPQIPTPRLREQVGDDEQWRSSARTVTRHLLGDLAEAIVTIIESYMSGKN